MLPASHIHRSKVIHQIGGSEEVWVNDVMNNPGMKTRTFARRITAEAAKLYP